MIIPDESGNTVIDPVRENAYRWACQHGRLWAGLPLTVTWSEKKKKTGQSLKEIERDAIFTALEKHGWNQSKTAKTLNIGRITLYRKMIRYGLKEAPTL